MDRVYLETLKLDKFRNYQSLSLDLDQRHVVLTGENGAGKTNILEAISFLSPGRGLRRATYDSVGLASGDGSWSVFANLQGAAGEVGIGTGLRQSSFGVEKHRRVHINGAQAKSADSLLEHCRVVWLTPSMDGLFTGPASDRRRFLDRMVLAVDPVHGKRMSNYEKVMRSRNKLLSEEPINDSWINATEDQLAELAVAVASARHELIGLLSTVIVKNSNRDSPFPDALVALSGSLENEIGEIPASDLETEYKDRLRSRRRLDAAANRTLEGPHRSDLLVHHRPKSMAASQCSTGEQKALLTGLLLAHARLVGEMHDFAPILLLDEIAAHLDEGRRRALYDLIDELGCQAWMTGTDKALFASLDNRAKFLTVEAGTVHA